MSTQRQNQVDIPLDEYIAKMNITSTTSNLTESSDAISEQIRSDSNCKEPTKQEATSPRSRLPLDAKPKVSFRDRNSDLHRDVPFRDRNSDLHRDVPFRYRQPGYQSSAQIDARNRIQQLRNRRRLGHRFFIEQPEASTGPMRPSITPPSSMQRQAVVMSGPSWEQMLPYEQLQQMATSAYLLSTFFNLAPPPPFNDPALFRR